MLLLYTIFKNSSRNTFLSTFSEKIVPKRNYIWLPLVTNTFVGQAVLNESSSKLGYMFPDTCHASKWMFSSSPLLTVLIDVFELLVYNYLLQQTYQLWYLYHSLTILAKNWTKICLLVLFTKLQKWIFFSLTFVRNVHSTVKPR